MAFLHPCLVTTRYYFSPVLNIQKDSLHASNSSLIPSSHGKKNIPWKKNHCNKIYSQPAIKVAATPGSGKSHPSNTVLLLKQICRGVEQGQVGIFPALSCQTKAQCSHHTGNGTEVQWGLNVVQCCCGRTKGISQQRGRLLGNGNKANASLSEDFTLGKNGRLITEGP